MLKKQTCESVGDEKWNRHSACDLTGICGLEVSVSLSDRGYFD